MKMNVIWTHPDPKEEGDLEWVLEENEMDQVEDEVRAVEPKHVVRKPHFTMPTFSSFLG